MERSGDVEVTGRHSIYGTNDEVLNSRATATGGTDHEDGAIGIWSNSDTGAGITDVTDCCKVVKRGAEHD